MKYYCFRPTARWVEIRKSAIPPVLHSFTCPQKIRIGGRLFNKNFTLHHYDGGEFVCAIPWNLFVNLKTELGFYSLLVESNYYPSYDNYINGTASKITELPGALWQKI